MTQHEPRDRGVLAGARLILVARRADPAALLDALDAFAPAGLRHVEVTLDTANCYEMIETIRNRMGGLIVGAGTVTEEEQIAQAVSAGAQFLVSPHGSPALASAAQALGIPYVPGAYTPTEVVTAWRWGVPLVKLFPIATLGAAFVRQLRGPLPQVPLIVTGGVTADNALEYRHAGADAVGLGSDWLRRWRTGTTHDRAALTRQVARLITSLEQTMD